MSTRSQISKDVWAWTVFLGMMVLAFAGCAGFLLLLAGCSVKDWSAQVQQQQRESVVGKATTDIVRESRVTPPETIVTTTAKDGTVVTLKQPTEFRESIAIQTAGAETSDSEAHSSLMEKVNLPLAYSVIGLAIGLLLLLLVFWIIRKQSTAVNAAWKYGNEALKRRIDSLKNKAASSSDPNVIAVLTQQIAELEAERAAMLED